MGRQPVCMAHAFLHTETHILSYVPKGGGCIIVRLSAFLAFWAKRMGKVPDFRLAGNVFPENLLLFKYK